MKGLLLKDFFVLKKVLHSLTLLMLMCAFYAALGVDYSIFSTIIGIISVLYISNTFSYDYYCKWDGYCDSMPVSRKTMVREKYLLGLILLAVATIASSLLILVYTLLKNEVSEFSSIFGTVIASVLMLSVLLPMLYKFGVEKARIYFMIIMFSVYAVFILLLKSKLIFFDFVYEGSETMMISAVTLIAFGLLFISYKISCGIMAKKEF